MLLLGAGVVLLAVGTYAWGYSAGLKRSAEQKAAGYQEAIGQIRDRLANSGFLAPASANRSVDGTVTAVGAGVLEIDAAQLVVNPLDQPAPIARRIEVGSGTKITKSVLKSAEALQAEMKTFEEAQKKFDQAFRSGKSDLTPPLPPTDNDIVVIELSDIKKGDRVRVAAAADMTYSADFAATEITVLADSAAPPAEVPQPAATGAAPAELPAPQSY